MRSNSSYQRNKHRILNEEWVYARDWTSDTQRTQAHQHFMAHYNEHRPHGALNWDTPMATLTRLSGNNVRRRLVHVAGRADTLLGPHR